MRVRAGLVQGHVVGLLEHFLRLPDYSGRCTAQTVWVVLCAAAAKLTSLFAICQHLAEEMHKIKGTVLTREYTYSPEDTNHQEYPFPDRQNQELYKKYRARAESIPGLLICGRLGEYRYYDMDQAIGRAMMLSRQLLAEDSVLVA